MKVYTEPGTLRAFHVRREHGGAHQLLEQKRQPVILVWWLGKEIQKKIVAYFLILILTKPTKDTEILQTGSLLFFRCLNGFLMDAGDHLNSRAGVCYSSLPEGFCFHPSEDHGQRKAYIQNAALSMLNYSWILSSKNPKQSLKENLDTQL